MPPARLLILAETSTEELQHLRDELGRLVAEHGTALVDGSELQDDEDLVEYEALCDAREDVMTELWRRGRSG